MTRLTEEQLKYIERQYTPPQDQRCPVCETTLELVSSGPGLPEYACPSEEASPIKNGIESPRWEEALAHYRQSRWFPAGPTDPLVALLVQEVRKGRPPYVRVSERTDYMAEFEGRWRQVVCRDGQLDIDAVARELSDYGWLIGAASSVYCDVTGGRISKPLTLPEIVTEQACEHAADAVRDGIRDELQQLLEEIRAIPLPTLAQRPGPYFRKIAEAIEARLREVQAT